MSDSELELLLVRINTLEELGRWEDALSLLGQGLASYPESADLHLHMAHVLIRLDRADKALDHAGRAVALAPDDSRMHEYLAWVRLDLRDIPSALEAAQAAIRLDPQSPGALHVLCISLLERKRYRQASKIASQLLEIFPDSSISHLAVAHVAIARNRFRDAEGACLRTLSIDAESAEAKNLLAIALREQGRTDEAEAVLDATLSSMPADYQTRRQLERVVESLHQPISIFVIPFALQFAVLGGIVVYLGRWFGAVLVVAAIVAILFSLIVDRRRLKVRRPAARAVRDRMSEVSEAAGLRGLAAGFTSLVITVMVALAIGERRGGFDEGMAIIIWLSSGLWGVACFVVPLVVVSAWHAHRLLAWDEAAADKRERRAGVRRLAFTLLVTSLVGCGVLLLGLAAGFDGTLSFGLAILGSLVVGMIRAG